MVTSAELTHKKVPAGPIVTRRWFTAVMVLLVVPVAHWVAVIPSVDRPGVVATAAFTMFALLLPAASLLREFVDTKRARLTDLARQPEDGSDALMNALEYQQSLLTTLATKARALEWGTRYTITATLLAAAALGAPNLVVWHNAPGWLVFKPDD